MNQIFNLIPDKKSKTLENFVFRNKKKFLTSKLVIYSQKSNGLNKRYTKIPKTH